MTKEEFADLLNGRQYREEMTSKEAQLAKDLGFFVFYGASDDLLEVRGLEEDEYGAMDGTTVFINPDLTITEKSKDPRSIFITAHWAPKDIDASWYISSQIGGASFDIMEDDELYCRGIVIHKSDLDWN